MIADLPEILRLHAEWLANNATGRRANLRGAYLGWADLRGADLQGANLQGADLQGAYLRDANLRGADLQDANLRRASLRGANLQGANLQGASLRGANLQGASLRGASLPIASDAGERLQQVTASILANLDNLNTERWYSKCGTSHSLARWAIHHAGPIGTILEELQGPYIAGLMLLGHEAASHFHDSNEEVIKWLRSISDNT